MAEDLVTKLTALGIDVDKLGGGGQIIEPRPQRADLAKYGDIGDLLGALFPGAPPERVDHAVDKATRWMGEEVNKHVDAIEEHYAAGFAAEAAHMTSKPNSSMALFPANTTAGQTYAPQVPQPLFPTQNGVTVGVPFQFVEGMTWHGLVTLAADSQNGWMLAGQSVRFADDAIAGVQFDTPFTVFQADAIMEKSPLGVYNRRAFISHAPVQFFASAVHRRAAPIEMIGGLIVLFHDVRCRVADRHFAAFATGANYVDAVKLLITERRRGRRSPRGSLFRELPNRHVAGFFT